jgi:hypothetical protein
LRQTRCAKNIKKQFWKLDSKTKKLTTPKPLKEGIFSVSGIFIKNYLRNLTC